MTDKVDPVQPTELLWFRGDCHIHSIYSDGEQTPPELAETARLLGLHFVATTDHNTTAAHHAWQQENIAQEFAVILREEVTTPHGHWLALGLPPGHLVDWQYADVVGPTPSVTSSTTPEEYASWHTHTRPTRQVPSLTRTSGSMPSKSGTVLGSPIYRGKQTTNEPLHIGHVS